VPRGFMARAAETVRFGRRIADRRRGPVRLLPHRALVGLRRRRFTPDIVVTGKPMGNGLPLAATAARQGLVDGSGADALFQYLRIESPAGGVGMAVLDVKSSAKACRRTSRASAPVSRRR